MLDRQISHYNQYIATASTQHQTMTPTALIRELRNAFTEWRRDYAARTSGQPGKGQGGNKGKHASNSANEGKNTNVRNKNRKGSPPYDKAKCFNCDKQGHYSRDCRSP